MFVVSVPKWGWLWFVDYFLQRNVSFELRNNTIKADKERIKNTKKKDEQQKRVHIPMSTKMSSRLKCAFPRVQIRDEREHEETANSIVWLKVTTMNHRFLFYFLCFPKSQTKKKRLQRERTRLCSMRSPIRIVSCRFLCFYLRQINNKITRCR